MSNERDFQAEVARSVPWLERQMEACVHYTKIPDMPKGPEHRFAARKGYDAFLVHDGRHLALEYKLARGMSLPFDALDPYQEACLLEACAAGADAYVVVCFRLEFSQREARKRGTDRLIATFAVHVLDWQQWRQEACRGSIRLEDFEARGIQVPRMKLPQDGRIGWDLRPLLLDSHVRQQAGKVA